MTLGEMMRAERARLGLSCRGLARVVGTHHGYISEVEGAKRGVSAKRIVQIAAALELNEAKARHFAWLAAQQGASMPGPKGGGF